MKLISLFILLFLVSCNIVPTRLSIIKINAVEYIILFEKFFTPFNSILILNQEAIKLCGNYTIKTTLGHNKYGNIKGIHIQCSI